MNVTSSNIATRCIITVVGATSQVNTNPNTYSTNNVVYYRTAPFPNDNCSDYTVDILYWLLSGQ